MYCALYIKEATLRNCEFQGSLLKGWCGHEGEVVQHPGQQTQKDSKMGGKICISYKKKL